jgi:hypothetical protein
MSANSVDSDQYVDGSIDTAHFAAGAVDAAAMGANSVDSSELVDGSVDLSHMSVNSIDSDQYVDGSIDLVHMSANSVDSDQYVDGSIDEAHLADDAVTADKLAANAVVNASVASGAAIALNKIDGNVDMGGNFALGNQANDVCQITGPIKLAANSILDSGNNGAITFDGSGNTQAAGTLTVGTDGGGKQFTAHGASANEFMRYIPGDNLLKFQNASSATILTLGGDATTEYALDVATGSDNINKIRAAAFVTYSDESLKCEVQTMNNALDTVMSLNGVEFTWNDSGERDFGFIAQDVQNVLPKAVHVAADGVQGVDYSRLTSVLVEAVKAQQVQITDLKKALTNLKK